MNCHLFIDEVGNGDLKGSAFDDNIRYLSLTGVIVKAQAHTNLFQPKFDQLKSAFFGHSAESPVILHRREILRKEGSFSVLRNDEIKAAFDAQILHLISSLPYIVITVAIDKRAHLEKYNLWQFDPYHYCLRCLVERYVLWLQRQNLQGDVVAEPRFKKADKRLKSSFKSIWHNGTEHLPPHIVRKHLLSWDIIFSPKSANAAGMQLCDLLAYPSHKSMQYERNELIPPQDFGNQIVEILINKRYARNPKNRTLINGWGRKWLP